MRARVLASAVAVAGAVVACVGDSGTNVTANVDDGGAAAEASTMTTDSGVSISDGAATSDGGGADACAVYCGGVCTNTTNDPGNCGACGKSCTSDAGTSFACVQSACGNQVVAVAAGNWNACALLSEGSVWCWGLQDAGVTGVNGAQPSAAPLKVQGLDSVKQISIGYDYACAVKTDGTLWCWGANGSGQGGRPLGGDADCGGTCSHAPKQVAIPGGAKVAQVACASTTTCARIDGASGGDVYCFGSPTDGILGYSGADGGASQPTPQKIPVFASDVIEIAIANDDGAFPGPKTHACAVRSDHTVWCWGGNFNGGLGHASNTNNDENCKTGGNDMACNPTPTKVAGVSGAARVVAGNSFSCALTQAGAVDCWGEDFDGELGFAGPAGDNAAAQVAGLNTTVDIVAGDITVLTLDQMGNVKGWGVNGQGELGLGDYSGDSSGCGAFPNHCHTSAVTAPLLHGAKQIAMTFLSGVALMSDGSVVTWGENGFDQLGHATGTNGDTACANDPTQCNPTPAAQVLPPWAL